MAGTIYGGSASGDDLVIESTSNGTKGDVQIQPSGGNVGVGTDLSVPADSLYASATHIRIAAESGLMNIPSGNEFHISEGIYLDSAGNWRYVEANKSGSTVFLKEGDLIIETGTSTSHSAGDTATTTEKFRITKAGDVGIMTDTPSAELEVNGYSMFGTDAPAIKMKKYTGTTPSTTVAPDNFTDVTHGLTASKILSAQFLVDVGSSNLIPPEYTAFADYQYSAEVTSSTVRVVVVGNCANVLSKSFTVLVTYEE